MSYTKEEGTIYPQVDPKEWCERYEIGDYPPTIECSNCGSLQIMNVPFASGRWRGLVAHDHSCPINFTPCIAAKATRKERMEMCTYFNDLAGAMVAEGGFNSEED